MKALKHLNKYFYKYRYRLLLGIFITIVAKIFALFTPRLIGLSINIVSDRLQGTITQEVFKEQLFLYILYVIGAAILAGGFTFLMRQTIINVSRHIEYDLKNEVYAHYQKLSLSFYKANRTGDLMNRITEDVSKVREFSGPAIMYSINTVTLFVVALIYMYQRSPELTLYTILPLPILSVFIYKISQVINQRSRIVQESLSTLSTFTQERFSGISVIKSYGIEPLTNHKFEILADENRTKQINLTKIQALFFPLMILIIGLSNIIVAYFGGLFYIQGKITDIGTIAEFLIYVNMLTWPVAVIGWVTNLVQQAEASQKRINEFLEQEPQITNKTNNTSIIEGTIEFKNVSYTYPDTNIKALENLSFKIPKGQTLAILGKTGSGKSTILDLIGRLYDVHEGCIFIDDQPIEELNLYDLRNSIGYVPQDAFLFSDSIKTNIKFGDETASDNDVITAAKNAKVHKNIVGFKNGYDTVLGERGITLSGGQKQRISIARAIIKSPQILLFDDCLSAVDTETEEQILKNLNKISSDRTTIIVSHRVSSAKNADQILVLEDGKILQSGKHSELIEKEGYYKDLYLKQLSEKEAP
jgi:ATP-binding cassette subfamily B protein